MNANSENIVNHSGSKYLRLIYDATNKNAYTGAQAVNGPSSITVDVYAVIEAFAVTCPGRQHALKKILCAGLRGKADCVKDLEESRDAISRAIDLEKTRQSQPSYEREP